MQWFSWKILLFFIILSIKRDSGLKEKIKLTLLRLFESPFSKYLIFKCFLAFNDCFGLFTKLQRGLGLTLGARFLQKKIHKKFYLILYRFPKFWCHKYFPSQDIKQFVLISYLDSWWHKLWIYLWSSSKAMAGRRKRGEDRNTTIWLSLEQKEPFRW